MNKISSGRTFFQKRLFPVFWFGIIAVVMLGMLAAYLQGGPKAPPLPIFLGPAFMLVIGFVLMKFLVFDLVDEVYDCGDHLLVKNGGKEERVFLSNIVNISFQNFTNPQRLTLTLRQPGILGKEITFMPKTRMMFFKRNPLVDELIERVDRARK
jgi:hypothetical protein